MKLRFLDTTHISRLNITWRAALLLTLIVASDILASETEIDQEELQQTHESLLVEAPLTPSKPSINAANNKSNTLKQPIRSESVSQSGMNNTTQKGPIAQSLPQSALPQSDEQFALKILGTEIPPGTFTRLAWRPGHSLEGLASQAPVLIVHGKKPGPKLCITAAVHGDELNGIEVVRRLVYSLKAEELQGTVIAVPIVNIQGFHRNSRYLVDRRDLNRYFPGNENGSLASRIAGSFFEQVINHCTFLVDVHTGSFYRSNLPQLRADLQDSEVLKLAEGFGSIVVIHSSGAQGTLRHAAVNSGVPAVTLELGGPMILEEAAVDQGVKGIINLLDQLKMSPNKSLWGSPKPLYYESRWVRVDKGGIFFSRIELGDTVKKNQVMGTITNPITNQRFILKAPFAGQVVGLAHNQVVYPGFGSVHLAIEADKVPLPKKSAGKVEDQEE